MTDAAVRVTQSVVEAFAEEYLRSTGCEIVKDGPRWKVTGDDASTEAVQGVTILVCDVADEVPEGEEPLHPESPFFQELLEEAGQCAPVGSLSLDAGATDVMIPGWLRKSDLTIENAEFVPYYDRTAAVVLFRISVETVSEYQRQFLRSVAIDIPSEEVLPRLDETVLELTEPGNASVETGGTDIAPERLEELIDVAREPVLADVRPTIDDIHREASRAADSEVEEYRQMQQQRERELREELSRLQSRIEELNEKIDESTQEERVEALKERKEYRSSHEEVEEELEDLRQRREQGFPERQREIRHRHALEVVMKPVTVTIVEYERGDADFEVTDGRHTQTITTGYGSGTGVTDEVRCDSCEVLLTEDAPLGTAEGGLRCEDCS